MRISRVFRAFDIPLDRYRKREGTVVKTIVSDAKVLTLSALIMHSPLLSEPNRLFWQHATQQEGANSPIVNLTS